MAPTVAPDPIYLHHSFAAFTDSLPQTAFHPPHSKPFSPRNPLRRPRESPAVHKAASPDSPALLATPALLQPLPTVIDTVPSVIEGSRKWIKSPPSTLVLPLATALERLPPLASMLPLLAA
jgi:hypothetical protein